MGTCVRDAMHRFTRAGTLAMDFLHVNEGANDIGANVKLAMDQALSAAKEASERLHRPRCRSSAHLGVPVEPDV